MKTIKKIIFLTIIASLFGSMAFAQNAVPTTITGKVNFKADSTLEVYVFDYIDPSSSFTQSQIPIHDGKFEIRLSLSHAISVSLSYGFSPFTSYGNEGFLVEPGDNLKIDYTQKDIIDGKATMTGKGSEKNTVMRKVYYEAEKIWPMNNFFQDISAERFKYDSKILKRGLFILDSCKASLSLGAYDRLKADWIATICYYDWMALDKFHAPNDVKEILHNKIDSLCSQLSITKKLYNDEQIVTLCYIYSAVKLAYTPRYNYTLANVPVMERYEAFCNQYKSPLREKVITKWLNNIVRKGSKQDLDKVVERFIAESDTNDSNIKYLNSLYSLAKQSKDRAQAYPFALTNLSGQTVRLQDFAGKVVLLDFMFTGCPGCRQMVPQLEELESHYKGKDVVFISISIEPTIAGWKKGIGESSVASSIQLYTGGKGDKHPVIKNYLVATFPHLVLIDKLGRLVGGTSAPDPRIDNGSKLMTLINNELNH